MGEIENEALALAKQYATEHGYEGEVEEAFIGAFIVNFEKGEKIGSNKKAIEVAKNLLQANVDTTIIA